MNILNSDPRSQPRNSVFRNTRSWEVKPHESDWFIFCFKKIGWLVFCFKSFWDFWDFSVDDVRWPGLSEYCMVYMHFRSHNAWLIIHTCFVCTFGWCWVFSLRCYCFFCCCNCQINDVIFFIVAFWLFASCLLMYIAQLFVCLFACFWDFCFYMCNSLLALFFAMVFRISSFIFVAKMLTFTLFVFCRFFSATLARFVGLSACTICLFLCS